MGLTEFKMWLQTVFKVNKKARPQATAASVGLMAVPPSNELLGIKVVGAQNLPLSPEGASYYCTCDSQGAPEMQLRTDALQGQGSVTWDQRMGLAPYRGGPLKFGVWVNSSWMGKLKGSITWMRDRGLTGMNFKLWEGFFPNAGRMDTSRLSEAAAGFASQMCRGLISMPNLGSSLVGNDMDCCLGTFELSEVDFTGADQDLQLAFGDTAGTVLTVQFVRPREGSSGASRNFRKLLEELHQQRLFEREQRCLEDSVSDEEAVPRHMCACRVKPCCPIS